jgi:adenylylsulfate kinase-like enzyme
MNHLFNNGPDITVEIRGLPGAGKSCLMGDFAAMLREYGCEVRCFKKRRDGSEQRIEAPREGHFDEIRRIKLVEVN